MTVRLRLGTRQSKLARWQADWVARGLRQHGVEVEIVLISTRGDRNSAPIRTLGETGLFTKVIQQSLIAEDIDLAVHSLKDLPTETAEGLTLACVPAREAVGDALICRNADSLDALPPMAVVGTGSLRRKAQLLHLRSDLNVVDLRGNVDTRLRKLEDGELDAIILAMAGLSRLDLADRITEALSPTVMLPAVGQGALGIETRRDHEFAINSIKSLDDPPTRWAVTAERSLLSTLRGGCLAPVGAWARTVDGDLRLDAVVLSPDGSQRIEASSVSALDRAESLGEEVASKLLEQGAEQLILQSRVGYDD